MDYTYWFDDDCDVFVNIGEGACFVGDLTRYLLRHSKGNLEWLDELHAAGKRWDEYKNVLTPERREELESRICNARKTLCLLSISRMTSVIMGKSLMP